MKRLLLFIAFLFCGAASLHAQGARFSAQVTQQGTIATITNAVTIPANPIIKVCASPVNAVPCSNLATTYTDVTLGTPCPTSTQIVRDGTGNCVSTPDAQNNWGVWLPGGNYAYTITVNGASSGPYYFTLGVGTGGTPCNVNETLQFNNSGAFGCASGSAVVPTTGAITLTSSADAVTPLKVIAHSMTQSVPIADFDNNSSLACPFIFCIRGKAIGNADSEGDPGLVGIFTDITGTFPYGLLFRDVSDTTGAESAGTYIGTDGNFTLYQFPDFNSIGFDGNSVFGSTGVGNLIVSGGTGVSKHEGTFTDGALSLTNVVSGYAFDALAFDTFADFNNVTSATGFGGVEWKITTGVGGALFNPATGIYEPAAFGNVTLNGVHATATQSVLLDVPTIPASGYHFNFPSAVGVAGQPLLSGGGGSNPQTYGGTLIDGSINKILYVDGVTFPITDLGIGINDAIATLPTAAGYSYGTIIIPPGLYNQSTLVTVISPYVSIIGSGGTGATQITCTLNATCWNISTSPFTTLKAGIIGGFTLNGQGNTNAIGMQLGGINSLTLKDLVIQGFTGSSSIGMLWNNPAINTWSERIVLNGVWLNGNKTDLKFTDTNSANDFFYWDVQRLELNTIASVNGTGIDLENDAEVAGGDWNIVANTNTAPAVTTNVFLFNSTSAFGYTPVNGITPGLNRVHIVVDNSGLTNPVILWNVASGAMAHVTGDILGANTSVFTNNIVGPFVNWIGATFPGSAAADYTDLGILAHNSSSVPANSYIWHIQNPASNRILSLLDPGGNLSFLFNASGNLDTPGPIGDAAPSTVAASSSSVTGGNAFGSAQINSAAACETSFGITTLSGSSTNTGLNCLPANAIIDSVVYRVTTTITTATSFTIGDSGSATRYCGTQSTLTAGTTGLCLAAGYYLNATATPVKITPSTTPGAGAIRIIVYYHTWTAPTS